MMFFFKFQIDLINWISTLTYMISNYQKDNKNDERKQKMLDQYSIFDSVALICECYLMICFVEMFKAL